MSISVNVGGQSFLIPEDGDDYAWGADLTNFFVQLSSVGIFSTDLVDNLTTNDPTKGLAASQGVVIKGLVDTNTANIATNTSDIATNDNDIAVNKTNILQNTNDIATNTSNIASKAEDADVIKKDGSVAFTGDQSMGNNQITNVGFPANTNDAVSKIYVDEGPWLNNGIYENGIINGAFLINQYNTTFPVSSGVDNTYYIDRTRTSILGGAVGNTSIAFITSAQPPELSKSNSIKALATGSGSGMLGFKQTIEEYESYNLESITFSAYVKANTSDARIAVFNGSTFSPTAAHSGGGSWERLSVSFPYDSSGGELTCLVRIMTSAGGFVSFSSGDEIEVTGMKLELRRTATDQPTDFNHRHTAEELELCQRYYQRVASGLNSNITTGYDAGFSNLIATLPLATEMRSAPTLVATSGTSYYNFTNNTTGPSFSTLSINGTLTTSRMVVFDISGIGTLPSIGNLRAINTSSYVALNAEI